MIYKKTPLFSLNLLDHDHAFQNRSNSSSRRSSALSIAEIDEINQNRPSSSSSNAYPFINIIHPEESEDIYAEQNRVPTLCWENLSQAQVE